MCDFYRRVTQIVVAVVVAVLFVCGVGRIYNSPEARYRRITDGMPLEQIEAVLGPGDLYYVAETSSDLRLDGTYKWRFRGGWEVFVVVTDGKLVDSALFDPKGSVQIGRPGAATC